MSFHIKDDFKAGAPISQVPAGWFNAVAHFLNGLVGGFGISTTKSESGNSVISLDRTAMHGEIDNAIAVSGMRVSRDPGTPSDCTDAPTVLDANGGTLVWTAGGNNGIELDCYCKIAPQASGSNYTVFQRCRLTFSKDGLLVKSELLADRVRIQAKNA